MRLREANRVKRGSKLNLKDTNEVVTVCKVKREVDGDQIVSVSFEFDEYKEIEFSYKEVK